MSGLILKNNEMVLVPYNDIRDRHLLLNYFTSYEVIKKSIWTSRGLQLVNAKEPRKLYEIVYGDNNLPKYYLIPRGLQTFIPQDVMEQILLQNMDTFKLNEPIFSSDDVKTSLQPQSGFDLRLDQIMIVTKMLKLKRGICQVATGGGKTECMASFIKILSAFNPDVKILVIEPTDILTTKTKERFKKYNIDATTYKESRGEISHTVTVSHVASLLKDLKANPDLLKEVTVVLQDEAQHLKADTWLAVNRAVANAEYSIGMSALAVDEKNINCTDISKLKYEEALIVGATGRVIAYIPPDYYIEKGILATPTIFQIVNKVNPKYNNCNDWHTLRKECICSESRSRLTAEVTKMFHNYKRRSLILVGVKQQAYDIFDQLRKVGIEDVCILFGGDKSIVYDKKKEKYVTMKGNAVDEFEEGKFSVLISTSVMDEGVDVSNLDVVILASGGKSDRRIIQRVGRALRKTKTGKFAYVVDFWDEGAGILTHHSIQRMKIFKELINAPKDLIFENANLDFLESKFKELEEFEDQLSFIERL